MKQILKFKTTLSCNGCKSKLAPFLNDAEGIKSWNIDLDDADKILTIHSDGITSGEVRKLIEQAGYTSEEVMSNNHSCH